MTTEKLIERPSVRPIKLRQETRVVVDTLDDPDVASALLAADQACRQWTDRETFRRAFPRLLLHVREWCEARTDIVSACYARNLDEGYAIRPRTRSGRYELDLDETFAALDADLYHLFPECFVLVLQMSANEEAATAIKPDVLVIYAE